MKRGFYCCSVVNDSVVYGDSIDILKYILFLPHRNWHRALCSWIHQPLLLVSKECYVSTARSATKGRWRRRLWESGDILLVRLPGHAQDGPGEFFIIQTVCFLLSVTFVALSFVFFFCFIHLYRITEKTWFL